MSTEWATLIGYAIGIPVGLAVGYWIEAFFEKKGWFR